MTFNGTWKVDRNDNYEKFMEQMGEWRQAEVCLSTTTWIVFQLFLLSFKSILGFEEQSCCTAFRPFKTRSSFLQLNSRWPNTVRLFPGINVVKRKLASHDNLKITIEQTGDKFHIKESSNFRTLEVDFTLGVTFEYSLADGTELSVSKQGPEWDTIIYDLIYTTSGTWNPCFLLMPRIAMMLV